jgi:hypothetical protein
MDSIARQARGVRNARHRGETIAGLRSLAWIFASRAFSQSRRASLPSGRIAGA